jgi:hypothetical protein
MEKKMEKSVIEDGTKVVYQTEHVNLQDFGYAKSGNVQGDPEVYANYLERIFNGEIVDEKYKGLTEKEREVKRDRIKVLEKVYDETAKNNAKFEQDIKIKEKQIEEYRAELLQISVDRNNDHEKLLAESFSPLQFWLNLFILLMLSGYLFFFYVSAAYKALYVDYEAIANRLADGLSTGSIMPGPSELAEALRYNYLLFLVPFVFFAFGWAFHVILEMKQKTKYIFLSMLIGVTFVVDFLIALIIHTNTETAKELMGLTALKWSENPTFYIILFMGFLVYIIWSILLDSLLREWKKRQITQNIKRIIKHLRNDIKLLSDKILPLDQITREINILRDEVNTLVYGNVKGYIDQFTTGWVSYLSPDNLKDKKIKCLNIKNDFIEKHHIQPGVVKVMRLKLI